MVGGCCVCSDERGWAENPLVYCDGHACSVAVHQGKAEGGGGRRGAAGPRGRRAHRVPSAAPSGALLGRVPLPHPPEAKGGVGSPPQPGPPGPGQALFSCLLFQSRAPHPKLKEFWGESREQGVNSLIPAPPVLGLSRECLPARYPPPSRPVYFGSRSGRKRSRGGHPPLLPDAGRSGIGKGGEGSHGRRDS